MTPTTTSINMESLKRLSTRRKKMSCQSLPKLQLPARSHLQQSSSTKDVSVQADTDMEAEDIIVSCQVVLYKTHLMMKMMVICWMKTKVPWFPKWWLATHSARKHEGFSPRCCIQIYLFSITQFLFHSRCYICFCWNKDKRLWIIIKRTADIYSLFG